MAGHTRTLIPHIRDAIRPYPVAAGSPWSTELEDPTHGNVRLSGAFHEPAKPGAPVVIVIHGLGGCSESFYCRLFTRALLTHGWGALRLSLRGADRRGTDYYHAGLTADIHATIAGLPPEQINKLFLVGFSLGGHVVLRTALEPLDPRVRRLAHLRGSRARHPGPTWGNHRRPCSQRAIVFVIFRKLRGASLDFTHHTA